VKNVRAIPAPHKIRRQRLVQASQYRSFVQGDMIGFVALDFVLWLIPAGMVNVTFVGNVTSMHFDNFSTHPAGFRIPTYMIANLERLDHRWVLLRTSVPQSRAYNASCPTVSLSRLLR
jgi:hypothetical protein